MNQESFTLEHGACPTCGHCRCCGQYSYTFPGLNITTTSVAIPDKMDIESLQPIEKLMNLIGAVRCNSSFPVDIKTVEDIINEQTD